MGNTVAIVSVVLALFAAGCVAYIAWELTSEDNHPRPPQDDSEDTGA